MICHALSRVGNSSSCFIICAHTRVLQSQQELPVSTDVVNPSEWVLCLENSTVTTPSPGKGSYPPHRILYSPRPSHFVLEHRGDWPILNWQLIFHSQNVYCKNEPRHIKQRKEVGRKFLGDFSATECDSMTTSNVTHSHEEGWWSSLWVSYPGLGTGNSDVLWMWWGLAQTVVRTVQKRCFLKAGATPLSSKHPRVWI